MLGSAAVIAGLVSRSSSAATGAPTNTAPPTISGSVVVGQTLSADHGTWTDSPTSYAYQWQQCDSTGGGCIAISGGTANTYTLQRADLGKTIRVTVTATNQIGTSAPATSAQTVKVAGIAPQNTSPPTFSPTTGLSVGSTVSKTSNGTWSSVPTVSSWAYQWQACSAPSDASSCGDITGATSTSYVLAADQAGAYIRLGVRATNVCSSGCGSTWAYSAESGSVLGGAADPPANTQLPSISGSAVAGQMLSASAGTWTSPATYTYQWLRCDSTGGSCVSISGATGTTYVLISADVGKTLRVTVTATNDAGTSSPATSAQTAKVAGTLPQNTTPPTFTPTSGLEVGGTVTLASKGGWTGIPTPTKWTYQWQSCDYSRTCADISGATATSYTLTVDQANLYIRLAVTAGNICTSGCGSTTAYSSESTSTVASTAPVNTSPPTILGTAQTGLTLTATTGTWNSTAWYAYQWLLCDSTGANCTVIVNATTSAYTVQQTDVGATIRIRVTASNSFGSTPADSAPTAPVAAGPPPPVNTAAPTVAGTPEEGQALQASAGTWSGDGISYAYQWQRCSQVATPCVDVTGATGTSYVLGHDDVAARILVVVTATNAGGTGTADAQPTAVVAALPQPSGDPVIAAAGDIACDPSNTHFNGGGGTTNDCQMMSTSNLMLRGPLAAVLPLGDEQYGCGGYQAFLASYDPSWGRVKSLTHPAIGNHEYSTDGSGEGSTDCDTTGHAAGYFNYFGSAAGDPATGYYSYDLAGWHFIALNSNCSKSGGCYAGSVQEKWLKADLAAHPASCTLAYWHHPRFSSVTSSSAPGPYFNDLVAAHAEIVLNGHIHSYERFAPQTGAGTYDPSGGVREFVVGTGGESLQGFNTQITNSEVQLKRFGMLMLTLHAASYDWAYVGTDGATLDSGTGYCH
jgi:hypothetical protein